jgi:hypothetical protein
VSQASSQLEEGNRANLYWIMRLYTSEENVPQSVYSENNTNLLCVKDAEP